MKQMLFFYINDHRFTGLVPARTQLNQVADQKEREKQMKKVLDSYRGF